MTSKQYKHIHEVLKKLQAKKAGREKILSVYLTNNGGAMGTKLSEDFHRLLEKTLTIDEATELKVEIDTIDAYLWDQYDVRNHLSGIAFFASKNIWEVINFDFTVSSQICYANEPYIAPLLQALAKEARYLFVIADREKAELLTFYQGTLEEYKEVFDSSVPQKVKSNKEEYYARNNIILRHIENHLHRHLQKISDETDKFIESKPVQGVFVGGHKPLFHDVEHHLNPNLQRKLQGEFVTELNIPRPELVRHAEKTLALYLQRKEVRK